MHVLLTNDDGHAADGLAALRDAVKLWMPDARVTTVAPAVEQSQCGHRVTTREPIIVESDEPDSYRVCGTPADCVRVALHGLGLRPDWVLSGINHGGNMGQDLVISGTVAAAREAVYHGVPAIALSHYLIRGMALEWERISEWTSVVMARLTGEPTETRGYWNVNFPHLEPGSRVIPEMVMTAPACAPLPVEFVRSDPQGHPSVVEYLYSGSYAARPREAGSDVETCFGGRIALTHVPV